MEELENFSDLDNLLSLADDEDFFLNSSESKTEITNGIVEYEENDCELVKTVKIGANPLKTSFNTIKSFFMSTFTPPQTQTRTQTQTKIKGQTSIAAFFKPPKRLPEEPIELEETKKMTKVEEKPFVFPSLKKPVHETSSAIVTPANGKKNKLPKFKLIPGTPFAVDAFSYGAIENVTGYFLTHFHSDHYKGLSNKLFIDKPPGTRLYCSEVTGNLVKKELRIRDEFITTLRIGLIYIIEGIHVGVLDANQ